MADRLLAPFVEIEVLGKGGETTILTDKIENFIFEESIEKDNLVEFNIVADWVDEIDDDDNLDNGSEITFIFGYRNGARSPRHRAVVTDLDYDYNDFSVNIKVRALDKGTVLKRTTSTQVYENMTSTDIAAEIAARNGLEIVVDPTTRVWEKMPQGNLDDLNFLRKLASREQNGNYIVYIQDNELRFVRRGLNKPSRITYTYGEGNNGLMRFKPQWRESMQQSGGISSTGMNFNPLSGFFSTAQETEEGENEDVTTEDYKILYSADGDQLAVQGQNESYNVEGFIEEKTKDGSGISEDFSETGVEDIIQRGKQVVSGALGGELQDQMAALKKRGALKTLQADINLVGNPLLSIDEVLTIEGVKARHVGNWYTTTIRHAIRGQRYVTEVKSSRNATKKPRIGKQTKVAAQPNKTVGTKNEAADEIVLFQFDANGNRTADITASNRYVAPTEIKPFGQ